MMRHWLVRLFVFLGCWFRSRRALHRQMTRLRFRVEVLGAIHDDDADTICRLQTLLRAWLRNAEHDEARCRQIQEASEAGGEFEDLHAAHASGLMLLANERLDLIESTRGLIHEHDGSYQLR